MTARPHLLLVDDEAAIREPLGAYLQRAGFRVSEAPNAAEARKILAGHAIDLVVLDIMMPGEDGLSLCRSIREQGELPVILLTARSEETDRIVGLEMGADDYVLKPFSPRELVARIKTILRRAGGAAQREAPADAATYQFEGWTLRADDWTLTGADGVAIPLSTADFRLLQAFVTHPRQVLSRDQLLDLTQGREAHAFDRSIDNQISRLRRKLEDDARSPRLIKTVWGGGYMFGADVTRA
ncbi:MAG TPA: response regulator [Sphingobium sp.]|nr:response regulator [Sphingobium sp.]